MKFSNDKIYYKTLLYTGKILEFEIKLNKYNKNKDAIIEQLEKKLKYYQRNGEIIEPKNEKQKKVREFFDEIRKKINEKEKEVFIYSINNIIEDGYYYFNFKFKSNKSYQVEKNVIKKIKLTDWSTCVGDLIVPKNSIVSYKIKIKKYQKVVSEDFLIGFGKRD